MTFTQIIEVDGVTDASALQEHISKWHADQSGVAPGYLGSRLLADADQAGSYLIEVDFASEDEARQNNDRQETQDWAMQARELADGEPTYRNLRRVYASS